MPKRIPLPKAKLVKVWGSGGELQSITVSVPTGGGRVVGGKKRTGMEVFKRSLGKKLGVEEHIKSYGTGHGIDFGLDYTLYHIDPEYNTTDLSRRITQLKELNNQDKVCFCWNPLLVNEYSWRCSHCHNLNRGGLKRCFGCQTANPQRNKRAKAKAKKMLIQNPTYRWRCTRCQTPNNALASEPPYCRTCRLQRPKEITPTSQRDLKKMDDARKALQLESEAVANKTSFKGTRNSSTALQQVKDYQKAQNKEKLSFQVMGFDEVPSDESSDDEQKYDPGKGELAKLAQRRKTTGISPSVFLKTRGVGAFLSANGNRK